MIVNHYNSYLRSLLYHFTWRLTAFNHKTKIINNVTEIFFNFICYF